MPNRGGKLDWDKLRVFHAVAKAGSFTHAADALNLSQSAVSRQIGALEEALGVSLFHRHARGLILTEQGDLLYTTVHDVFAKLNNVEDMLTESKENPEGALSVTTTVAFGSIWLTGHLKDFIRAHPKIEVTLRLDDRELDLAMREADVAIRFHEPTEPDLIQRHLGQLAVLIFASPDYLAERGTPQRFEDLARHDIVTFGQGLLPFETVNWMADELARRGIAAHAILRVNNIYGIYTAVKNGLGIGMLPEYFLDPRRQIVRVLPEVTGPPVDGYFVYPAELRNSARVAVFRDYLIKEIAKARAEGAAMGL
ncbi:MAG: LysR family transcriptional regulator [Rhodospirillaceae bacterium]|nr:LysR family transcriptional regulator [Rhodospirillaceae bacterium]